LRLLREADRYPIRGNEDWRASAALQKEARARAATATASPDDPPEFIDWLTVLRDPSSPESDREAAMSALYDLFDPEDTLGTGHFVASVVVPQNGELLLIPGATGPERATGLSEFCIHLSDRQSRVCAPA